MAGYRLQTYIKKKKESQSTKEKHQPTALRLLPESPKISTLTCANGRGLLGVSTDPSAPFQTYPSNPTMSLPDGCAHGLFQHLAITQLPLFMDRGVGGKLFNLSFSVFPYLQMNTEKIRKKYGTYSINGLSPIFPFFRIF